ncbi:DUF4279 domain-containing protein [Luteimonas viscosa]|nr:DUF4279 domain-containing protein [Luteimonas viscosa]
MNMADDNASIDSLMVGLYIYGDDLLPEEISSSLGALATRSHRKGELKELKGGKFNSMKTGMWELRSTRKSLVLSEHIADIFSNLKFPVQLSSMEGVDEVHLDVYVSGLLRADGYRHLDLELTADDMLLLGGIGAAVRFSVVD